MSDRPKWSKESKENNKSKKISETRLERKKIYRVNIPENRYVDRLEKKKKKRKQGENWNRVRQEEVENNANSVANSLKQSCVKNMTSLT